MNNKLFLVMSTLSLTVSLALAQTDEATGTLTNDETQGRLRVNYCVFNGPSVDVLVNGEVAVNGGIPQTDIPNLATSGYLYLAPNTYSVAVVPTGKELSQALMGPVDVPVQAGHRYTVVVLGQADEATHQPLVIDETAAYQDIGAKPTGAGHITVNNAKGSGGVTFTLGGVVREENVPYGEFQAALWPTETYTGLELAILDTTGEVVVRDGFPGEGGGSAGEDFIDCVGGTPGTGGQTWANWSTFGTSTLSTVDFLKVRERFTTFLNALETAGLTDLLTTESPYMLFAPTDEAFEAMPKEELDALMAEPEALADFLQAYIVPGYYPTDPRGRGIIDRTVTNLVGADLLLTGSGDKDFAINGVTKFGEESWMVANGSRVFSVSSLLPQPSQ